MSGMLLYFPVVALGESLLYSRDGLFHQADSIYYRTLGQDVSTTRIQ
jgi:hypothetical protein